MKQVYQITILLVCFLAFAQTAFAQATLSIQGVIKNSDGTAVANGKYSLTFRLYTSASGGTAVWSETQDNLLITGGIYSALLGEANPLTAAFDQTYYLSVSVDGGAEHTPRAKLTSSPYALSLIGTGNIFPSTGTIGAGTASPSAGYQLHTKSASGAGRILLEGSTAAYIDFKKGDTYGVLGFGSANNDFLLNPGANNTTIQYGGSTKLTVNSSGADVAGTLNAGTLNAATVNATTLTATNYSPANMAITSKLAVGQGSVDASYALKIAGQTLMTGGGLRVEGNVPAYTLCSGCSSYDPNGVHQSGGSNWTGTGIFVSGLRVDASGFLTQSDRRIKTNLVHPTGSGDLSLLKKLQVTDYQYIDKMVRGTNTVKGFIAQEVEEVLPQAITLSTEFVPSVFSRPVSTQLNGKSLQIDLAKAHGFKKGDKVRIYTPNNERRDATVAEVISETAFSVNDWTESAENLFVFGKEVNDFHAIDFDQLTSLNISATQELARKVELLEKENAALKAENGAMKASAEKFEARLRSLENKLSN